jgi:uncharacterized repeat protein (TIGR03943 family)
VSPAGGLISLLVGVVLLRLEVTGTYSRYVRVGMGLWLVVAGVAVIVLGSVTLARTLGRGEPGDADAHDAGGVHDGDGHEGYGHEGYGGSRMGWLLLAPIAALLLVAPPTLGSYGVDRGARVDVRSGAPVFRPLTAGSEPVAMTLLEFGQRAFDHDGASFNGVAVRLTGFVAATRDGGGFRVARYQIACCAADAAPVVMRVVGVRAPPRDRWVTVTGTFQPAGGDVPQLAATSVVQIRPPEDPYE